MRSHPARAVCLLAALAACGGGGGTVGPMRYDSGEIAVVRHPALSAYPAAVRSPRLLLEVGAVDGPPERVFGEVGAAALLASGQIAVLDRHAAEVRIFAPDGSFLGRAGRFGRGPGELSGEGTLALLPLPGGGFAVPDIVNQTVAVFRADGTLEATHPYPGGDAGPMEWRVLSGDTLALRTTRGGWEIFLARTLDGRWEDTVAVIPLIRQGPTRQDPRAPLPRDHRVWAMRSSRELLTARMSRPELEIVRGGATAARVSWAHPQRELSSRDADHLLGIVARRLGGQPGQAHLRRLVSIAPVVPALANVHAGPAGTVMVQRLRPVAQMDRRVLSVFRAEGYGGRAWDVFSARGAYLGALDLGGNAEIFQVSGDTILGMREGESGEARIFLARLPAFPPGDAPPASHAATAGPR